MARYKFTKEDRVKGGRKAGKKNMNKKTDATCPHCGKRDFKSHAAYIGHLGNHKLADNHFGGDVDAALGGLAEMGQASTDPMPWNGAFARQHKLLEEGPRYLQSSGESGW